MDPYNYSINKHNKEANKNKHNRKEYKNKHNKEENKNNNKHNNIVANGNIKDSTKENYKNNEKIRNKSDGNIINNSNKITKNIRIYSYNSRGFDEIKQKVCEDILNLDGEHTTILCNQENFVLKGNGHLIKRAIPNHHIFIKPATKTNFDGRPVNGMFVALPKDLRNKAKDVSPNHNRIQAVRLETDESTIMIVNVYFPRDPKTIEYSVDTEFEDVLATIENLVDAHHCNDVLILGDLNCDYSRNNGRVKRIKEFLSSNSMDMAWNSFNVDYTHEFENNSITYTSTIDHILWNHNFRSKILNCGALHPLNNTSDHSPIYCDVRESVSPILSKADSQTKGNGTSVKTMTEEDWNLFHNDQQVRLESLEVPDCVNCRNTHCKNEKHRKQIDSYVMKVLGIVDTSIKKIAGGKRENRSHAKVVPGWVDIVRPFHENARFWNAVWRSAGKPLNTVLHTIMKKTRNQYHYAIRKCKRASENLKKEKLLNTSLLQGNNNIFDEIRKMRKTQDSTPSKIDGYDNPAQRFSEVYEKLYNSTEDALETNKILKDVDASVGESDLNDVDLITPDLVNEVVKEIRSNKCDPVFAFNSDCIKRSPYLLYYHIACMIKCFLIHAHVSNVLMVATIIPLLKDKLGDVESSDNYRSIALSSVILKIYDWIVMTLFGDRLNLDELQFSYQKNCSTTMCTWLVVETVSYFTRNGNDVHSCFMDMKKAFDMVKHGTLFKKLVDRKLPWIHLRLLLVMYKCQTAKVKWKGTLSDAFSIINGVKQGAVISAILFCIYIDDLIKELRRKGDGCWINDSFVGVIIYADDIALLSPSLDGLQNMINTCAKYATKHNLTFSTHDDPKKSKTKCMVFQKKERVLRKLKLNGKDLPWVRSVKHLGSTITNEYDCRMSHDLMEKRARYVSRNNELVQEFFFAHPSTKIWINNVYNTSFYSSPLWSIYSKEYTKLEKSWNVSQRIMLDLPRTTHRYFLEPLSKTTHVTKSLMKRYINFIGRLETSSKNVLRRILHEIRDDCRSTTGRNIRKLLLENKTLRLSDINLERLPYKRIPEGEHWKVGMVEEIIGIKSGTLELAQFDVEEVADLCASICSD